MNKFAKEVAGRIAANTSNDTLVEAVHQFIVASTLPKKTYN